MSIYENTEAVVLQHKLYALQQNYAMICNTLVDHSNYLLQHDKMRLLRERNRMVEEMHRIQGELRTREYGYRWNF